MKNESISLDSKYIEQLTWLRGIAAFFVIVSHTLRATEVSYSSMDQASDVLLMRLFDLGSFGVILFFVLSGCTLYISNSDKMSLNYIGKFYTKRFFRIWPAFTVSLIVYILFSYIFAITYPTPQGFWVEKQFLTNFSASDILLYLTLTFNITGPADLFNNAFWSLPVEFQYYFIFPLILAALRYAGLLGPVILSIALYFLPQSEFVEFDNNNVFTLAFSFCGGVIVGYVYKSTSFRIGSMQGIIMLIILTAMATAIANAYITLPDFPIISNIWNWFGGIGIITVYIALITNFNFHNKVELFLKHYGTISYSTYLYHNLFVAISVLIIINFNIYDGLTRIAFTFSLTLIATYVLATFSFNYIEKPFIVIGRNLLLGKKQKTI